MRILGLWLLVITNGKSYTGSRLAPNSMILNDLERQNSGFYGFFGDFGLQHKSISFTRWRHATFVMRSREMLSHVKTVPVPYIVVYSLLSLCCFLCSIVVSFFLYFVYDEIIHIYNIENLVFVRAVTVDALINPLMR